ncbi:MAG TPA: TetR/AcrR family transcriptional regulator, partial [Aggregatilineales bacterium]|nr:TetR/AcrR family transcriptional regulator [Aggregatilineales bacterium]
RVRSDAAHETMSITIKQAARALMVEKGTAGVTIRGIAKRLAVTPPALYTYVHSVDDLITALIVEDFTALSDALAAAAQMKKETPVLRLRGVLRAYRQWAVDHPMDFQLIYGNPIPGYVAPREVTVPAVARGFAVIIRTIEDVLKTERYQPQPPYDRVPQALTGRIAQLRQDYAAAEPDAEPVSDMAFYLGIVGWSQMHGLITLEVLNHLQGVVANTAHHFDTQMRFMIQSFGIIVRDNE